MNESCFSYGRKIDRMASIFFLALVSAAYHGVGRRGGFYPLSFPAMNVTVGIYPRWSFRSVSAFVDFSVTSIILNILHVAL